MGRKVEGVQLHRVNTAACPALQLTSKTLQCTVALGMVRRVRCRLFTSHPTIGTCGNLIQSPRGGTVNCGVFSEPFFYLCFLLLALVEGLM